jgi:hypothetical protein
MTYLTHRVQRSLNLHSQFCTLAWTSLVLIALLPLQASAQWTTNGTNTTTPNNVGIGTVEPGSRFESVTTNEAVRTGGFNSVSGAPTVDVVTIGGYANSAVYNLLNVENANSGLLGSGTSRFVVRGDGNVGIGTASPGARLDIGGGDLRVQSGRLDFNNQARDDSINLHGGWYTLGVRNWTFYAKSNQAFRFESYLLNSAFNAYEIGSTGGATFFAVKNNGNVGIGNSNPTERLEVLGNIKVIGNIDVSGNINAKYQDVAEWVPASEQIPAGTVVVLDATKSNHVISSTKGYDTRVAGVISEQPGITLGERGDSKVLVATTGRVRIKVDATRSPILIGDLLVTSDVPGLAMKSEPIKVGGRLMHMPGTLIGKALEPLESGSGKILVLLSLQ